MQIDNLLSRLKGVKRNGNGYLAICPGHDDHKPSLSITLKDDRILLHCHAGCELADILRPLNLEAKDLFLNRNAGRGSITSGKACELVNTPQKHTQKGLTPSLLTSVNGITLAELADAKRLPVDFLKSLGLTDFKYNGRPAVRIPYFNEVGELVSVRFRLSLSGEHRFAWRRGDKVLPYGLDRLELAKRLGWTMVVEGESDCWTLWFYGLPAFGIPGKGIFSEAWGRYLEGVDVYLWQEPGAEDLILRTAKAAPDLKVITAPDGIKDMSVACIRGLDLVSLLEDLKAKAVSAEVLKTRIANARLGELYQQARTVIEANDPLELVQKAIRSLGYGGDVKPAIITYLAATSRLLAMRAGAMPVHLLLTGQSTTGKSYTKDIIKRLLPPEVYHEIDAGSPHVLIYDDADLAHRVLIFGEADSLPAGEDSAPASAIRNLLQDHFLHYQVTIRDKETGDYTVRKIDKPGPTVLITTSTRSLGDQLSTRLFTLGIADSAEQINAALITQAGLETEGDSSPDSALVSFQAYLQLKAPWKVVVPFARELASAMCNMVVAPRILRDFARLLSLVKAVAILRHHKRQLDGEGRIIARLEDYETVCELVADMYTESTSGAVASVRQLVEAVRELDTSRTEGERITNTALAKHVGIGIMQASRRAKKALEYGWLINREQRKYHPANYAPGEPMPEVEGLPALTGVNMVNIVNNEAVNTSSFKIGTANTLTPLTDGDTHPPTADYPTHPCSNCGCGDYWLRKRGKAEWLCSCCHPDPNGSNGQ